MTSAQNGGTPGIGRRLASMLYEALLLVAVLFIAAFLFIAIARDATSPGIRPIFQLYLVGVVAAYFLWYWLHGGQTLPMKTWRLRLVSVNDDPIRFKQACLRFILATIGIAMGLSIIWALFDRDRQFLHDRLAGTKIISS
jgi:uncharacterized RDD family membrane protein YckC